MSFLVSIVLGLGKIIFVTIAFIITFLLLYVTLPVPLESLKEAKKLNKFLHIFFIYGVIVVLVYFLYLPILKIGGVSDFTSLSVIFKAYLIALVFVTIPRFFIFSGNATQAEQFVLVLTTAIFMALTVYVVGHDALNISSFLSTNIYPNGQYYLLLWVVGIIVGIIIELLGKYVPDVLNFFTKIIEKVIP